MVQAFASRARNNMGGRPLHDVIGFVLQISPHSLGAFDTKITALVAITFACDSQGSNRVDGLDDVEL